MKILTQKRIMKEFQTTTYMVEEKTGNVYGNTKVVYILGSSCKEGNVLAHLIVQPVIT